MTAPQSLKIYEILNLHFKNPEQAKTVVESIEEVIDEKVESQTQKFVQIIQKDIAVLRTELKTDIADLRTELKTDYIRLEGKLETKIAESKTDMIKWFVGFFVALALMIIGLYFKK